MQLLYEDADVIAVAKPAGIAVIPGRDETAEDSLRGQLEQSRKEQLWVVHRIDRDTSGVVLFARNEGAHRALSMAFEGREVQKTYLAWTRGVPSPAEGTITTPLHPARKGKMRPTHPGEEGALPSETHYRVELAAQGVARVSLHPTTGRQHQIRVHLRSIETPLLVDPLYGRCESLADNALGEGSPAVPRLTLHASKLVFPHPRVGSTTVECSLPADLAALDSWLVLHAQATAPR